MDLSAPGVGILTAVPPALDTDGAQDGYQALDGTSFSAPMVSAAMAWVRAARPDLTPDRVIQAVRLSARDVKRPGWDPLTGFGVLNVGAALRVPADKLPIQDPLEPNDNLVWVDGRAFGKARRRRSGRAAPPRVNGLLDKQEDPVDVYRIVVPAASREDHGDPALRRPVARGLPHLGGLGQRRRRRGRSLAQGGIQEDRARDGPQPRHRKRSYYIAIRPQGSSRYQERQYTLRVG